MSSKFLPLNSDGSCPTGFYRGQITPPNAPTNARFLGGVAPGPTVTACVLEQTEPNLLQSLIEPLSFVAQTVIGAAVGGPVGFLAPGVKNFVEASANVEDVDPQTLQAVNAGINATQLLSGGANVGDFFDFDFSSLIDDFSTGNFFEDVTFGQLLNVATPIASTFLTPNQGVPAIPVANRASTNVPAVIPTQGVSRSFFNRFPALATVVQALKNAGRKVTPNSLYDKLVQFGIPAVTGLLTSVVSQQIATQAIQELALRGKKRRRMNSCNAKALRRAMRRVRSFNNMKMEAASYCRPRKRRC